MLAIGHFPAPVGSEYWSARNSRPPTYDGHIVVARPTLCVVATETYFERNGTDQQRFGAPGCWAAANMNTGPGVGARRRGARLRGGAKTGGALHARSMCCRDSWRAIPPCALSINRGCVVQQHAASTAQPQPRKRRGMPSCTAVASLRSSAVRES